MEVDFLGLYLSALLASGQDVVLAARPVEFQSRWQWLLDNPGPGVAAIAVGLAIAFVLHKTRE